MAKKAHDCLISYLRARGEHEWVTNKILFRDYLRVYGIRFMKKMPKYKDDFQKYFCSQLAKAGMPVMPRPRMSAWMSCVPSYVFTASRFITCLHVHKHVGNKYLTRFKSGENFRNSVLPTGCRFQHVNKKKGRLKKWAAGLIFKCTQKELKNWIFFEVVFQRMRSSLVMRMRSSLVADEI